MPLSNFPSETGFRFKIISNTGSEDISCISVEKEKVSIVRGNETDRYLLSFKVETQNLLDFIEKSIEQKSTSLKQYEHCTDSSLHLMVLPNYSYDNGLPTIGFKVTSDKSKSLEWFALVVLDPFTRTLQRFIFNSEMSSLRKSIGY